VDITLTITSDPGPSSSSAITGTLSVSGFGAGSEGDCFNLNDGAIAGYRTADGIFLHGTVGESSEESDPENGNWRETHQYSLSAKVIPTGMSNGALKLASELLSCQRQPIAPRLTDGIGIDLSLVEAPTSTPSGQAPPAPGWDRSNAAVSTPPAPSTPPSAVLSIPVARAIKQFPPEFTASIDRVGITLTVDGRDIAEYENSTVTDLPSHDAIECSKGRMACDETVTPEPMEAEDMTAISARDGSFFAAKVLASASAIESMGHDPMTNHYKVTDWSELGPGSYRVVAEWLMDNGCGKRTITIDSLDYTASIDTSIAPACSAAYSNGSPHYPPKYETIVLSRGFSVAAAVQKSSSSNGGPGPLSPEQSAASQQMQPSDSSRNAPTVSPQGAVELGGLNARALNAKALQLLSTNPPDLNGAKLALEKAAQLDPADIEILNNLGDVYGRNGEYRSAEAVLLRVLSLAPNRRVAFGNLGSVEAKLGKTEAAANYFCQYVRRFDSLQKGKTTLARVFVDPDPNVQNAVKTTMANCMP
jgi:hypothetical protein